MPETRVTVKGSPIRSLLKFIEGELTGVRNARVTQTRCCAKGAPACEWDIQWECARN